jgi:hypothetical protein
VCFVLCVNKTASSCSRTHTRTDDSSSPKRIVTSSCYFPHFLSLLHTLFWRISLFGYILLSILSTGVFQRWKQSKFPFAICFSLSVSLSEGLSPPCLTTNLNFFLLKICWLFFHSLRCGGDEASEQASKASEQASDLLHGEDGTPCTRVCVSNLPSVCRFICYTSQQGRGQDIAARSAGNDSGKGVATTAAVSHGEFWPGGVQRHRRLHTLFRLSLSLSSAPSCRPQHEPSIALITH